MPWQQTNKRFRHQRLQPISFLLENVWRRKYKLIQFTLRSFEHWKWSLVFHEHGVNYINHTHRATLLADMLKLANESKMCATLLANDLHLTQFSICNYIFHSHICASQSHATIRQTMEVVSSLPPMNERTFAAAFDALAQTHANKAIKRQSNLFSHEIEFEATMLSESTEHRRYSRD